MTHQGLWLPEDGPVTAPTLRQHLATSLRSDREALTGIVEAIAEASVHLARRLALGVLPGDPAAIAGRNESGDPQKALDLAAHGLVLDALRRCSVATVVSEEAAEPLRLSEDGLFDIAIDPIDGSGSIGIGAPLGLLFAVFPRGESLLRSGREVTAAGYVSFGHSTDMGVSLGSGVAIATLDPAEGLFRVTRPEVRVPARTRMIAVNASNYRHFAPGLRRYLTECASGETGPRGEDVNMRWIAAAVGDLHRILLRGGLFLYPGDARPGYASGHLRLLYEAFPIAFLIEQAGGGATDLSGPVLDRIPCSIHEKTPLAFGASEEVARLQSCLTDQGDT